MNTLIDNFLAGVTPNQRAQAQQWLATLRRDALNLANRLGAGTREVERFLDDHGVTNNAGQVARDHNVTVDVTVRANSPEAARQAVQAAAARANLTGYVRHTVR